MATLTGKIIDVTSRPPGSISSITVKAPSARIGSGTEVITSSPANVDFNLSTGDITISDLTGGLSWLYIEGDGWSDSIAFSVADGMVTLVEAIANALGMPGLADYIRLLAEFETRIDGIAQDALDSKAEQKDLESVRDRVDTLEPVEATQSGSAAWSHATGDGHRLPLGYTPEGRLDPHARQVWSEDVAGLHGVPYDRKYARVYSTPEGHVLAAIMWDGTVEIPRLKATTAATPPVVGGGFARREKYRHTDGTLATVMAGTARIAGWGSSSLEGMTGELTGVLSDLPVTYHNFAKGGEWIEHNAARMGAIPALVDPVTIPANGSVAVTVANVPANANMRPFTGHLSGVHGTLSSTTTDFTFTRTSPGDPITLSGTTEFIPDIDPAVLTYTTILQLGKNNFTGGAIVMEDVPRITRAMLAYLRPLMPRVLILGHHGNTHWTGSDGAVRLARMVTVNEKLRDIAGEDSFIDVQGIITSAEIWDRTGITPTADDLQAQAEGRMAPSLGRDTIHFNAAVDQAFAEVIRERIDYLGWY